MQPRTHAVAILFADICDSMPLYEKAGDAGALAVIAACLDEMASLAVRHGGEVIRSKGDDVLCIFDSATGALAAAAAMLEARGRGMAPIHVGVHAGAVIRAREDVYGDAVNLAARMLALAKPGEMVASKDFAQALPVAARERLVPLGRRLVKGKPDGLDVYSMVLDDGARTQILGGSHDRPVAPSGVSIMPSVVVELYYEGQILRVGDGERCVIGRAERCDLRVEHPHVSREHACVQVSGGRATFIDRSTAGSWILDRDGTHSTLRRESTPLDGHGALRLARHPRDPGPAPEILFSVRVAL